MIQPNLRPLERAILRRREEGLDNEEIARRFGRSPAHVERIIDYTRLPRPQGDRSVDDLRPLERRVLRLIGRGVDYEELASAFKRTPSHMRRVAGLAYLRKARTLLSEDRP